jgi:hypothetical protein
MAIAEPLSKDDPIQEGVLVARLWRIFCLKWTALDDGMNFHSVSAPGKIGNHLSQGWRSRRQCEILGLVRLSKHRCWGFLAKRSAQHCQIVGGAGGSDGDCARPATPRAAPVEVRGVNGARVRTE